MIEIAIMSSGQKEQVSRAIESISLQSLKSAITQIHVIENANAVDRESQLFNCQSEWLLFLDEDCSLPTSLYLENLLALVKRFPQVAVWGGLYLNPSSSCYSVQAYNSLCNLWVLLSQSSSQSKNFLGGCLALHVPTVQPYLVQNPIGWGGEDTFLIRNLQKNGIACRLSHVLSVEHSAHRQSLSKTLRRGFVHGKNRRHFRLKTSQYCWKRAWPEIKKFYFWPLWAVHFLALTVGSLTQQVDLRNKNR